MLYSALSSPILWQRALFLLPHFLIGGIALGAALERKCWIRNMSGTSGLVVQGLFGGIFFFIAVFAALNNIVSTVTCRHALSSGNVATIQGPLKINKEFWKPGYGYIEFSIDGHSFKTLTDGFGCDCGYIQSVGYIIRDVPNAPVRAQVKDGVVLSLERTQ